MTLDSFDSFTVTVTPQSVLWKYSFEKISVESVQTKNYKLLHAYVQCVYIVSAKYQIAPSKAVVGVDPPIKALSMHIQN